MRLTRTAALVAVVLTVLAAPWPAHSPSFAQKGRSLQLMTPARWDGLTEQQRDLYTAAVLETWGYGLYADGGLISELSDFVACVHQEKLEQFRTALWVNGELETPVAEYIFEGMRIVCEDYTGKGAKTGKPLQLIFKSDWASFDAKNKAVYITAYLELTHHVHKLRRAAGLPKPMDRLLEQCLARIGVDGVISQVRADEKNFKWQYPLPRSIGPSLGKVCRVDK